MKSIPDINQQLSNLLMAVARLNAMNATVHSIMLLGSKPVNLRAIIGDAFQVDKEGQLNTGRILSLRRVKIQDERWNRAMEAISESLQVAMSKTYINFREKDKHGKLINIPLDIAAI